MTNNKKLSNKQASYLIRKVERNFWEWRAYNFMLLLWYNNKI